MRQLLEQWIGVGDLSRDVEFATLTPAGGGTSLASEHGIEPLVQRAAELGVDVDAFERAVAAYVNGMLTGTGGSNDAFALLAARRSEIEAELAAHPVGVPRTETLLQVLADTLGLGDSDVEAYADPAVDLRNQQRQTLARAWREQWLQGREERRPIRGEAFWVSADFQELYDDVAYYRVYERYGFAEFDELFDDVAKGIGEALLDGLAGGDPFGRYELAATSAYAVAETLWLTSRSRRLRQTLAMTAVAAVTALFHGQHAEGYWPAPVAAEAGAHPPSARATAMAIVAARRLSRDDAHCEQCDNAITWLLGGQRPDGAWVDFRGEPDVVTTAIALDAIARSGRPGTETVCERAGQWLVGQQHPSGLWQGTLPDVLLCVTVVDALRSLPRAGTVVPDELAAALALVTRAEVLTAERSGDSRQLAVVAAYTGLEGVLYALLSHPSFGIPAVRPNGQSIGFDQALLDFEAALVGLGRLQAGRHVAGHNVLRGLTHIRDGVVHRGARPSAADAARITTAAVAFCREHVPATFGFDPLDD